MADVVALKPYKRYSTVALYVVAFWVALPLALVMAGRGLDAALHLALAPSAWGWALLIGGLAFVAWAALWLRIRGDGLPVSALPPPRLVVSGPYGLVRHPMYLGYNVALIGLALILGSPGLLILGGPVFLLGWVIYALIEERSLRRRFGAEYRAYQVEVAIWPRLPLYRIIQILVAARALPVTVEGRANLPRGPYVIVANHACYMDPAFLSRLTWRPIRFLATAEAFRPRLFGWALRRSGAIPLRRYRVDSVACRAMLHRLAYGEIVGLFVEGERSPLGVYEGAMPRAAGIIARLGVPVIPVGINGDYDAGPRWSDTLRRRPVTLRVGPPIDFTGKDPRQALDVAISALLDTDGPRVHLKGLPRAKLSRVLWACPRCLDEPQWDAAALRCGACGARFTPTPDGLFADADGRTQTLATLGERLVAVAHSVPEITCDAQGAYERKPVGPIRPLEPIGAGSLHLSREALTFTPHAPSACAPVSIPMWRIRSVTTERADTLQVATATSVWQFQPSGASAFRLYQIVMAWASPRLERPLPGSS
ncbi:MAG TPA: 1-acyl-sn-glycerol-3-phosphate acyltransferase [Ktedonobacterales bacterium]|jgi:1-acyl-sn-glycerol-3-phosphate acyltransferase|nr:1-acyl-sn-glycerol-3-phosphate acyltransferase [Ktedonobacterales bacterium]